jgi:hypothetical protein
VEALGKSPPEAVVRIAKRGTEVADLAAVLALLAVPNRLLNSVQSSEHRRRLVWLCDIWG